MKQAQSRELYAYWNDLYLEHGIPERSLIEPASISRILGDTFILEFSGISPTSYRLAGTRHCAAFGGELKGQDFIANWQQDDKTTVSDILVSVASESVVALLGSTARSKGGRTIALETLILPLLHNQQTAKRFLGITTPVHRPYWLGTDPIGEQALVSLRIIEPIKNATPFNARFTVLKGKPPVVSTISSTQVSTGRKVGHLVVLEGGKSEQQQKTLL